MGGGKLTSHDIDATVFFSRKNCPEFFQAGKKPKAVKISASVPPRGVHMVLCGRHVS